MCEMHVAGIMVVIARFQWVGVMDYTNSANSPVPAGQSDGGDDADKDEDHKATSSPCMQYFIKVRSAVFLLFDAV